MKDSKNFKMKKRESSSLSSHKPPNYARSSIFLTILPYFFVLSVGVATFIFLFPEVISKVFPSFSFDLVAFFTNLGQKISDPLQRIFSKVGLIIIAISGSFILGWFFSPYIMSKSKNIFCQRKLFFPFYYKVTSVLFVSNTDTEVLRQPHHSALFHAEFFPFIAASSKTIQMTIMKYKSTVGIYFTITMKGFSRKKLVNNIQRKMLYIANYLDTYYSRTSDILTAEQTKLLLDVFNKMRFKSSLTIHLEDISLMDLIYSTLSKEAFTDNFYISLVAKRKKKESDTFLFQFDSFSDNVQALEYFRHATGFSKKSSLRKKQLVEIETMSRYIFIPLNYQGTFPLHSRKITTSQEDSQSILLGYESRSGFTVDEITIEVSHLLYNTEIYGMIGQGKTRLVTSIIDQLLQHKIPCLIFDIKGEYATTFVNEPGVEIYTMGEPHPLCINLFDTADEDDVRSTLLIIEEMMATSNQEFSPSMKNLFETALFKTHLDKERSLETFVNHLLTLAKQNRHISSIQHTLDAVLNRINFIFNPINFEVLGVNETTLDFDLLNQDKSIIFDLSQFQRRAARPSDIFLICNLILKMFYRFASAQELTNKLRYVIVLEEAINIIPHFYRTESSASLITAENSFLLGRSLGIGHVTISQMWDSVSQVVHANSATKIVFRSGGRIDKLTSALNLQEKDFSRLKILPKRHCFVSGDHQTTEMVTLDFLKEPLNRQQYAVSLKKKYQFSSYPLLYSSFIAMRTSLYDEFSKSKEKPKNKIKQDKPKPSNANLPNTKTLQSKRGTKIDDQKTIISANIHKSEEDSVCNTFCSLKSQEQACFDTRSIAQIVYSVVLKEFSEFEIEQAILGTKEITIEDLLEKVALERKLPYNKHVLFCAQRELTYFLMAKDLS